MQETWRLVDKRISVFRGHQDEGGGQISVWSLSGQIQVSLQGNHQLRAEEAGAAVESLLASKPLLVKEARIQIQGWYKYVVDPPPPPQPG